MKKLMVALSAMAISFAASAMSCNWATTLVETVGEEEVATGTYWVLCLGDTSSTAGFEVFEDGTYNFGTATIADTGDVFDAWSVAGSLNGLTEADNGKYYALVVWDGNKASEGGMWGISDAVAMAGIVNAPPTNANDIEFMNGVDSFDTNALFTNTAVSSTEVIPEPTSGLLMLLGMAGLALRRRRA